MVIVFSRGIQKRWSNSPRLPPGEPPEIPPVLFYDISIFFLELLQKENFSRNFLNDSNMNFFNGFWFMHFSENSSRNSPRATFRNFFRIFVWDFFKVSQETIFFLGFFRNSFKDCLWNYYIYSNIKYEGIATEILSEISPKIMLEVSWWNYSEDSSRN